MAQVRVNALSFAIMVEALYTRPRTLHQVAEITGLHVWTVRHYVKALHKQGMAHITGWDPDVMGRDSIAYYAFGPGVDVPRRVKTGAQKMRDARARKRAAAQRANGL